jgi:hypothetical protein
MSQCIASVAVVGAGDYIGSAMVRGSHVRANTWLPAGERGRLRNVWKLACYAGFLTEREASRRMLPHAGLDFLHRCDGERAGRR